MNKEKKISIIEAVFATLLTGLLVYSAYSLWYVFCGSESGLDVHLYTGLTGLALGFFAAVFTGALKKDCGFLPRFIAFMAGNGFFHGLIWGLNARINAEGFYNDEVVIRSFSVAFILSAVLLTVAFTLKAKKAHKALNIILAIVYLAVSCGGFVVLNKENIKALSYKKNIKFDTVSAEEMHVTDSENEKSVNWFEENLIDAKGGYPFTFKVDGEEFNPDEWEKSFEETPDIEAGNVYRGGKTEFIIFRSEEKGLEVKVEATEFSNNATCQWAVYIRNTGKGNSGVISDFYALDSAFETGKSEVYYSMGSDTAASDFSLIKKNLSFIERSFSGADGKPTQTYLPYFNINGDNGGIILGVGWTGQWLASMKESKGNTEIKVKQENFEAYLLPDEEIRSPLVSVTFYENENPLKGFNLFRKWITDCVYSENITQNSYTVMEVAGPASERTSDEIIEILDGLDQSVYSHTDAFWMDAGWYSYNEGWYDGVGNWTVDTSRYDNGISELSDYAKNKGLGHVLWYEPERVYPDTHFHKVGQEHEQWLIYGSDDNIMWNLANEEAFDFYCEYLLNSMKENGVTVYRQDFNFAPLEYWQKADEEFYDDRKGICENHYVTNLYRYLDYLKQNIDGLIIDNCASGGKRLDLEMTYRSIAFWRSDYNCSYHPNLFDATQSHTYGISFWLPVTGSALYMADEYACRSAIMPLMLMDFFSHQNPEFGYYSEQKNLMSENYYPLDFGSFDNDRMMAMQFSNADALEGMALVYKRTQVKESEYTVRLNGLTGDKSYEVYDIDSPEKIITMTGSELMNKGIRLPLPEGEKAIILMFSAK